MDLNQIMQLANNPQVRQLLEGLMKQLVTGQGGQGGKAGTSGLLDQLQKAGMDIAEVMPAIVDHASPSGQLDVGALKDVLSQLSAGPR